MDQASYNDFISYINENMLRVQELLEKVTSMHYEATKILLDTCTLFHPQILIELNEMETNGRKCDDYILAGQEMKTKLTHLTPQSLTSVDEYRQIMEEIGLLNNELDATQNNVQYTINCNP